MRSAFQELRFAMNAIKKIIKWTAKTAKNSTVRLLWKLIKLLFLNNKGVSSNAEKDKAGPKDRADF